MISPEQIAAIDSTVGKAIRLYPECGFLHVGLDTVVVTGEDGEVHQFDTMTGEEMAHFCEVCYKYQVEGDMAPDAREALCRGCAA